MEIGPRPAGSPESRRLARLFKRIVPRGRYQEVPGGLRNVIGTVRGREPGYIVVGAHYDTKDIPGFVGANDGASGHRRGRCSSRARSGARGTRSSSSSSTARRRPAECRTPSSSATGFAAARSPRRAFRDARAMILLDFVGDSSLAIKREGYSDVRLWRRLRAAAQRVGAGAVFPATTQGGVLDDHIPFLEQGVRSIDLIDFDFPCWHRSCDDMSAVSERSVDAVGETMYEFCRGL